MTPLDPETDLEILRRIQERGGDLFDQVRALAHDAFRYECEEREALARVTSRLLDAVALVKIDGKLVSARRIVLAFLRRGLLLPRPDR